MLERDLFIKRINLLNTLEEIVIQKAFSEIIESYSSEESTRAIADFKFQQAIAKLELGEINKEEFLKALEERQQIAIMQGDPTAEEDEMSARLN